VRDLPVLSFAVSPNTIDFGSSTTLSWNVKIPAGCTTLKLDIGSQVVGRQSSLTVQPLFDSTYTLRATFLNKKYGIASASVKVNHTASRGARRRASGSVLSATWRPLVHVFPA
jgi:hypothetical protein